MLTACVIELSHLTTKIWFLESVITLYHYLRVVLVYDQAAIDDTIKALFELV